MDVQLTLPVIAAIGAGAALLSAVSVYGMKQIVQMGQFSYHNARLSTIGNPYVTREEVLPLVELADPASLIKSIQGDLAPPDDIRTFREVDRVIMSRFHASVDLLLKESPRSVRPLVSAFMNLWEMEELKRLLRMVGKRTEPLYPVGYLDHDLEVQFLKSSDLVQAVELLEGHSVNRSITPLVKESGVGLDELDAVLDRYVLDAIFDIDDLPLSCRKGTKAFSHLLADRYNIQLIIRAKMNGWTRDHVLPQLFTRGGTIGLPVLEQMTESSSLRDSLTVLNGTHLEPYFKEVIDKGPTAVEIALDQMLLDGSIDLSHSFGLNVGPTIRYMVSKEMEMKNLRTLFQAAFAGWDPEKTKRSLILQGVVV